MIEMGRDTKHLDLLVIFTIQKNADATSKAFSTDRLYTAGSNSARLGKLVKSAVLSSVICRFESGSAHQKLTHAIFRSVSPRDFTKLVIKGF